mmetsp:Transcript_850/g.1952  ORF Transcript_850/g.1952 Transcript_850/m.1952 type:complete len:222 (-) Transcript_850:2931-3596(-)
MPVALREPSTPPQSHGPGLGSMMLPVGSSSTTPSDSSKTAFIAQGSTETRPTSAFKSMTTALGRSIAIVPTMAKLAARMIADSLAPTLAQLRPATSITACTPWVVAAITGQSIEPSAVSGNGAAPYIGKPSGSTAPNTGTPDNLGVVSVDLNRSKKRRRPLFTAEEPGGGLAAALGPSGSGRALWRPSTSAKKYETPQHVFFILKRPFSPHFVPHELTDNK